jgi:ketosteroid isomerase-like protein
MGTVQAIADRVEIEALRGESMDAQMMDDYDRFSSLFTPHAMWRVPAVSAQCAGREEIRAGIERLKQDLWDYLVQTTHPGTVEVDGDTADGLGAPRGVRVRPRIMTGPKPSWCASRRSP